MGARGERRMRDIGLKDMTDYTRELNCTLEELWAIHHFVRYPSSAPDYAREMSKQLSLDVFHGIGELEPQGSGDWVLWCTDDELWWISRLVPKDYAVGTDPVGRTLLAKVMALLWDAEEEVD